MMRRGAEAETHQHGRRAATRRWEGAASTRTW